MANCTGTDFQQFHIPRDFFPDISANMLHQIRFAGDLCMEMEEIGSSYNVIMAPCYDRFTLNQTFIYDASTHQIKQTTTSGHVLCLDVDPDNSAVYLNDQCGDVLNQVRLAEWSMLSFAHLTICEQFWRMRTWGFYLTDYEFGKGNLMTFGGSEHCLQYNPSDGDFSMSPCTDCDYYLYDCESTDPSERPNQQFIVPSQWKQFLLTTSLLNSVQFIFNGEILCLEGSSENNPNVTGQGNAETTDSYSFGFLLS